MIYLPEQKLFRFKYPILTSYKCNESTMYNSLKRKAIAQKTHDSYITTHTHCHHHVMPFPQPKVNNIFSDRITIKRHDRHQSTTNGNGTRQAKTRSGIRLHLGLFFFGMEHWAIPFSMIGLRRDDTQLPARPYSAMLKSECEQSTGVCLTNLYI